MLYLNEISEPMILLKADFVGVFFFIIYIGFIVVLLLTPIVLAFLLYRWLKKKGKFYKLIGLSLIIAVTALMSFQAYKLMAEDFLSEPVNETVKINQDVGGVLVCNSTYTDDLHGWEYSIDYSYSFPNDSTRKIGTGMIYAEKWKRDEQIIKIDDWYILKASKDRDADVLFIGNAKANSWKEFVISPETIESCEMWKNKNIPTQIDNWDTVAKIEKIYPDGTITVKYKFRKANAITNFQNGIRRITYKLNSETGYPEMKDISEV